MTNPKRIELSVNELKNNEYYILSNHMIFIDLMICGIGATISSNKKIIKLNDLLKSENYWFDNLDIGFYYPIKDEYNFRLYKNPNRLDFKRRNIKYYHN